MLKFVSNRKRYESSKRELSIKSLILSLFVLLELSKGEEYFRKTALDIPKKSICVLRDNSQPIFSHRESSNFLEI